MSVMESADTGICSKQKQIKKFYNECKGSIRLLQSFANLSNTVIQTSLSGQNKFVFEILQNADDAFEDPNKKIKVKFILQDDYLIVQHNGKGFDYNDVERICDYASQIEEVKATDLNKTGYKGLGFKSLFNLSDTIYIHSNGYCFRFDKTHWSDWQKMPWHIIPIWCQYDELPLHTTFSYDEPVNIILKINSVNQLEVQLTELISQPDLLLFLNRIEKVSLNIKGNTYNFKKTSEIFGEFIKINVFDKEKLVSTWLSKTYKSIVPQKVKTLVQGGSNFIFPDKIKTANEVQITFAIRCNEDMKSISSTKGLLYSTLPTQLDISLPYHVNSSFILNLDRSLLHENEWNEFLMKEVGSQHLYLLRDIAGIDNIRNDIISVFCRKVNHPLPLFRQAYSSGFSAKKDEIGWLPAFQHTRLLRLCDAWVDETEFFKQNFRNINDNKICPYIISYALKNQNTLSTKEDRVKYFNYSDLFKNLKETYCTQLTETSYPDFVSYIYMKLKDHPDAEDMKKFKELPFLRSKEKTLVAIKNAIIEERGEDIPDCLQINNIVVDKTYLPKDNIDLIVKWFRLLGSKKPDALYLLSKSILNWISENTFHHHMNLSNHIQIINYLSYNIDLLPVKEFNKLKDGLLLLTESNEFKLAKKCHFSNAVPTNVFENVLSKSEIISSSYVLNELKDFFIRLGVCEKLTPIDVVRRSIFMWIKNNRLVQEITTENCQLIIDYLAEKYPDFEKELLPREKTELKKLLIFTSENTFQEAKFCYFDSVIPDVKGLVEVIPRSQVILKVTLTDSVIEFLKKIGVSDKLEPTEVIRRTVLRWITENKIRQKVTIENHEDIIKYIANNWDSISCSNVGIAKNVLDLKEKESLKKFPILTEGEYFREAENCYWQFCTLHGKQQNIPNLDCVISNDELVSRKYDLEMHKQLFNELGVQKLEFTNIYEKYSDHLNNSENAFWFLLELTKYWEMNNYKNDNLLNRLKDKFSSDCCLLAKDGNMYRSSNLYHSCFLSIDDMLPCLLPLLSYDHLPSNLEDFLGFKSTLDLDCIVKLLSALSENSEIGQEKTKLFFTTLLEQLKNKDGSKIKQYSLSLLSKENKLKSAKELYYFEEEDATCELNACYLKRIHDMSHEDTLELAKLCGVNILPYDKEIKLEKEKIEDTLKEFYMVRLPFIVALEAIELNENPRIILERLYDKVSAIQLYQCQKILVQYPFGDSVLTRLFYDEFNIYVFNKWSSKKSKIHEYLKKQLEIKSDIIDVLDMDPLTDRDEWLDSHSEDTKMNYYKIEKEMKSLTDTKGNAKPSTSNSFNYDEITRSNTPKTERNIVEIISTVKKDLGKSTTRSVERQQESSVDELISESNELVLESDNDVIESEHEQTHIYVNNLYDSSQTQKVMPSGSKRKSPCDGVVNNDVKLPLSKSVEITNIYDKSIAQNHPPNKRKRIASSSTGKTDLHSSLQNVQFTRKQIDNNKSLNINNNTKVGKSTKKSYNWSYKQVTPVSNSSRRTYQYRKFTSILTTSLQSGTVSGESQHDQHELQRFGEECVFSFLQEYYKSKHPNSICDLSNGCYTLSGQSSNVKITWLNESNDMGLSYDFILKKDDTECFINVKSILKSNQESLNTENYLETENPEHKNNFSIYTIVFPATNIQCNELEPFYKLYKTSYRVLKTSS